jgi:hypothetical protein
MNKFLVFAATALLLAGCGADDEGTLSGTYKGGDEAFFDSLKFSKDGTVEIALLGSTTQASWKIEEGDRVLVATPELFPNVSGELFRQTPDKCLDGGKFTGKYCKGSGGKQAQGPAAGFGGAYASNNWGVLNFETDGTFEHYLRGGFGAQPKVEASGTWKARGNKVLIAAQGSSLDKLILEDDGCLRDPSGGYGQFCQTSR